eukprot:6809001-Pyramimonas_sp.AAC.1
MGWPLVEGAGLPTVNHEADVAVLLGHEEAPDAVGYAAPEGDEPAAMQRADEVPPLGRVEAPAEVPARPNLRDLASIHELVDVRGGPVDGSPLVAQDLASLGRKPRSQRAGLNRAAKHCELRG